MNQNPEVLKNLKHNLRVNILDGAFFGFALGFSSFVTILPLFVSALTGSALLIGLIPAIHNAGWQFPQLFTAGWVSRQRRIKPLVVAWTVHERLPFLGLALVAWFLPVLGVRLTLVLTFLLLTWQGLGAGFTANPWQSMVGKIIPSDQRGTFLGTQAGVANLLASVSAILAGLVLSTIAGPLNFAVLFLLTSVFMVVSWVFLTRTREPESSPAEDLPLATTGLWAGMGVILKRDRNFRWFLAARMASQGAIMAFAFYTVFAVSQHGVSAVQVSGMTSLLLVVQIVANLLMGRIGDRWSHGKVMQLGLLAATLSALLAWLAPSAVWFYLVFALAGIANVAVWTIGISMSMEFGSEAERPAYIGMANTLIAPVNILAPFLGGWLADQAGYPAAFIASAACGLAALLLFHFKVAETRRQTEHFAEMPTARHGFDQPGKEIANVVELREADLTAAGLPGQPASQPEPGQPASPES